MEVAIKSLMVSDMSEVTRVEGNPPDAAITSLDIFVPCIRNIQKIAAGEHLVLRWGMKDGKMDYIKWCPSKRDSNALDEQAPSPKKGRM